MQSSGQRGLHTEHLVPTVGIKELELMIILIANQCINCLFSLKDICLAH